MAEGGRVDDSVEVDVIDLTEALQEVRQLREDMHRAQDWLRDNAPKSSQAEAEYRKARAKAWLEVEGTAAHREAQVDALTADLRYERDLGERLERAALEKIRSCRQEISLYQSLLAAHRAEAEFTRTGPEVDR